MCNTNEIKKVKELIKKLKPIDDFSILKKGDKIFNRCSLSVDYIDIFDHIENWGSEKIIFYINHKGESWNGPVKDYWFYIQK